MKLEPHHVFPILCAFLVLAITGCSNGTGDENIPEVNAENCKPESINKIKDKPAREAFASKCFRTGKFERSPNKTW